MHKKKVDVLGTEYSFIVASGEEEYPEVNEIDAFVDFENKICAVNTDNPDDIDAQTRGVFASKYRKFLARRELIKAFCREAGIFEHDGWTEDDSAITWVAEMFPKMEMAFEKIGCDDIHREVNTEIGKQWPKAQWIKVINARSNYWYECSHCKRNTHMPYAERHCIGCGYEMAKDIKIERRGL